MRNTGCLLYYTYAYVKALLRVLYATQSTRQVAKMLIKHEGKSSALLTSRPHTECFISRKAQASSAFTILKNFQRNVLIKTCILVQCNLNGANS